MQLVTIRAVHAIELSSLCSLRCVYCPSRDITDRKSPDRPAMHMERAVFERALEWAAHYVRAGTQTELNLTGIGESMLHPDFEAFARLARAAVGPGVRLTLPTNGLHVTDDSARLLAELKVDTWVSLHRPEKAGPAYEKLKAAGVNAQYTFDPVASPNDWAGQVKWKTADYRIPCPWMLYGHAFVMADGSLAHCCLDSTGKSRIGHVRDPIGSAWLRGWSLCATCYQEWGQTRAGPDVG